MQFSVFGQELKPKQGTTLVYIEEYNILTTNKKVRQGDYKKYRKDGSQVWTGKLDNNNRVGEWNYYENGEIEQTYNYDEKKLVFQKKPENPFLIQADNQIEILSIDTPPSYLGSKIGLTEELNRVLEYPMQAKRMMIEGPVTVGIWINEDGSLGEIELIKGIMKECDQDLISAIRKIPNNWFVATIGNKKVKSKLIITADYKLDNIFENAAVTVR
jgi:TonB family protein